MTRRCWLCRWFPCALSREERAQTAALVAKARGATLSAADAARRAAAAQDGHQRRSGEVTSRISRLRVVNEAKARRIKGAMDTLLNRMRDDA